eukprot:g8134.t1
MSCLPPDIDLEQREKEILARAAEIDRKRAQALSQANSAIQEAESASLQLRRREVENTLPFGQEDEVSSVTAPRQAMPTNLASGGDSEALHTTIRLQNARMVQMQEEVDRACTEAAQKDKEVQQLRQDLKQVLEREKHLQKTNASLEQTQDWSRTMLTGWSAPEARVNRLTEECEKLKAAAKDANMQERDRVCSDRREVDRLTNEVRKLERQRTELVGAFKKQMKLIEVLKRQRAHMEAARVLSFTEARDAVIPEEVAVKRPRDDEEESKGKGKGKGKMSELTRLKRFKGQSGIDHNGKVWKPEIWMQMRNDLNNRCDLGCAAPGRSGQRKLMAIEELEQLSEGAPTQYIVAQGDPTSQKILKAKRPVGSKIYTTGTIWKGPQGGVWAEVDIGKSPGEMGWALVEGPGFGLRGPSLIDPEANDGASQMIHIRWLKDPPIFNCLMPKTATVGDLVDTFCARTGLNRKETILTKGLPNKAPNGSGALLPVDYTDPKDLAAYLREDVLFREMTIEEAKIRDTLNLVYVGHFDEDYNPS